MAEERGVMGFLRKCGGELRKVVKMDWDGITKYILGDALQRILWVGLGRRNKELNEFLGGEERGEG